jgi:hypothetical protein
MTPNDRARENHERGDGYAKSRIADTRPQREPLFARPTYQLASIDLFRGHRHYSLRHESTHEHALCVSKGTFLLGPKGTFELGRYTQDG